MSKKTINKIKAVQPTLETLTVIAEALNVDIKDLLVSNKVMNL